MRSRFSSIATGVLFIIIGIILLLNKLDVINFGWDEALPFLFIALSVLSFFSAFTGKKGNSFWGGFFGILGVFYLLQNYDVFDYFWFGDTWPVFMLAFGIGFIVMFLFNPRDWGVLIPGGIFTFLGLVFFLESLDLAWITMRVIKNLWPLILVLIGIGIITSSLSKQRHISEKSRQQEQ
ncbi:MAG TPA: DUF5668 domain-containing protein [bacterium]|nr:DUF5668 domain-containing protein [bacterium]HPN45322.1 DUF5668 domain-containing protein [bacterium]